MRTVQTWSCDIFQSDGLIWKSDIPSRSLEPQDHFMICNERIDACNATLNFGYMNGHSSHLPKLNYGCKIECLHMHSHERACYLFNPPLIYVYEVDALFWFMMWFALLPCLGCCLALRCMIGFHMLGFLICVRLFIALRMNVRHNDGRPTLGFGNLGCLTPSQECT